MDRKRNMVMGSLIGDSVSLGLHWIYNIGLIDKLKDDFSGLMAPKVKQYHGGKEKGQHTHYGDQTIWLLQSIAENGGFVRDRFAESWLSSMKKYAGYIDHASTETMEHPDKGSDSDDLAGASRLAPVLYAHAEDHAAAIAAAGAQTEVTHNNQETVAIARALAEITLNVLGGSTIQDSVTKYAETLSEGSGVGVMIEKALESAGKDTRTVIGEMGQMCSLSAAFPASLHVVLSYPDDMFRALTENVLAGGDQAARGMAIGMILGAAGLPIPQGWLDDYAHAKEVSQLLDTIG